MTNATRVLGDGFTGFVLIGIWWMPQLEGHWDMGYGRVLTSTRLHHRVLELFGTSSCFRRKRVKRCRLFRTCYG